MMNRMQENDYQAMKQRLVTICEVQAGTISATEAAERLGVSRKTFYEYMDAFVKAAAEALTPGDPGRPKLSDETRKIRQLEAEKKRLENELYEMKAISECSIGGDAFHIHQFCHHHIQFIGVCRQSQTGK